MSNIPMPGEQFTALQPAAQQLTDCAGQICQQIEQQKSLTSIVDRIRSSLDLELIFQTTAKEVRQLLQADRVGVFCFTPEKGWDEGEFVSEDVAPEFTSVKAARVYDHSFGTQFASHYAKGRVQAVADIYHAGLSDCHIQILEQFQVRANLIIPVLKGDDLWGLLCIHQCRGTRQWQTAEIEFVRQISSYFAIALQQAEYLEQIKSQTTVVAQAQAQAKALTRQKALVRIASQIRQSLNLAVICQTATEAVRQLLEADRVTIYCFNSDWSGDFLFESVTPEWLPLVGVTPTIADTHLMDTQGGRYAAHETFAVADIYQAGHTDCHVALLEEFQARAYAIAPIFQGERLWGLLTTFQNSAPRQWEADEVELLAQIGEQLGIALQQANEYERAINRQKALVKIVNKIRKSLSFAAICQTATEEVRQVLEADRVTIYRFNPDWSGDFLFESVAPEWQPLVGVAPTIADTHLMATQGGRYAAHETFAVADIYQAGHTDCHVALLEEFQARAYAIAPIFQGDCLWGLLTTFQNSAPRPWKIDEVELLAQIGEQLGIALQQAEYLAQIQAQSFDLSQTLHALQQSQAQLIQNEKMASLGQLVAGIAHEINNPINFIYGNLTHVHNYVIDLLALVSLTRQSDLPVPPAVQTLADEIDIDFILADLPKILTSMKIGTDRIRQIVISLRNFSRLDEAELKIVDIHEGIDSTLLILGHRLRAGDAQFEVAIVKAYGEIPLVECYPAQLNQVFMNLLDNALDAIAETHPRRNHLDHPTVSKIWISTQLNDQNHVEIRIRDTGMGVDEKNQSKIFDHFFTTKPVGKGTGLGLAIARQIVEQHAGTLTLNSTPGQGAEFVIRLPIRLKNALIERVGSSQAKA